MFKMIRWIGMAGVGSVLLSCLGNPTGSGSLVLGPETLTYSYSLAGNILTFTLNPSIYSYCQGNNLVRDTSDGGQISFEIEIQGDSLKLYPQPADTLPSGAVVQYSLVYCRTQPGYAGLQGSWTPCAVSYRLLPGPAPTVDEQGIIAAEIADRADGMETGTLILTFDATRITVTDDPNTAQEFIDDWNDLNAGYYDVILVVVDKYTVELRGGLSSEIVRIAISPNGDMVYSSNDAAHATHRYLENPTQCPNPREPAWYGDFLDANIRIPGILPLPKPSAGHRAPRIF